VSFGAGLTVAGSVNFGSLVATGDIVASQFVVKSTGSDCSYAFQDESGTNRASVLWQHSTGSVLLYNAVGGGSLTLDQAQNITITNAALKPGGGPWLATSDARIKNVIGDYRMGLDQILALEPVQFTYRGNDTPDADSLSPHAAVAANQTPFVGLIAQQVETIFPGMVMRREGFIDGVKVDDLRDLDTSSLIFALVNAVKTLKAEIEVLKAR
jgi:hypothetical protein